MGELRTRYSQAELLASHSFAEPNVVGGIRCHGGFDEDGRYLSPRMLHRGPAIAAWEQARAKRFGTPQLDIELSAWPGAYPSVDQARFLLSEGVREPVVATLTRIGTVEGFGAYLRHAPVPDLRRCFVEDVEGTAMAHLAGGLFEAHARDEAGHGEEAGHRQMWFAARDLAFENPVSEEQTQALMARMGLGQGYGSGGAGSAGGGSGGGAPRRLVADIDPELEVLIQRMARLLLIEISAFHTFAWAEELLSDAELVAGEGRAATIVSWIRSDEEPHVAYLKVVLSEMRDRTFAGPGGRRVPGTQVVGRIWEAARSESLGPTRRASMDFALGEVERALASHPRRAEVLEEFHRRGRFRPGPDGQWVATGEAA
jgi:hypothetical protein